MSRKLGFWLVTLAFTVIVILALVEVNLRLVGIRPWVWLAHPNEPTMHEPDPVVGWKNRPGKYLLTPYDGLGPKIRVTLLERGRRATMAGDADRDVAGNGASELVLVGGSMTQGWAITDDETYPWKLQQRYPALDVLNYGTGGYGTYQSFLVLERELSRLESPVLVLYSFIEPHEARNLAFADWRRGLAMWSRRGHVEVPYATLDSDGSLVRHPPLGYDLAWPLREASAAVSFLEFVYARLGDGIGPWSRRRQKIAVTERLMLEMDALSKKHGARLAIVILEEDRTVAERYLRFLGEHGITGIDCGFPLTPDMQVVGEGHPNGKMNTRYADCVGEALDSAVLGAGRSAVPGHPSAG